MLSPDCLCSKHTKTDCQQKRFGFYKILLALHSKTKPSLSLTQNRHASTIVTVWSIRAVQFRCTLNSCHGESLQLKSNKDAVKTLAANQQRKKLSVCDDDWNSLCRTGGHPFIWNSTEVTPCWYSD